MDVEEIVESAMGTVWGTALRADQDGYVPPGVDEWTPGKAPIEHLENGEQPHFIGVSDERALKVRAEEDVDLESSSRAPLDKVQQGIMYDGKTGYLSADEPYPNILFLTDRRLLLFVGKDVENPVVEFRYDDDDVIALTMNRTIQADGLEYELGLEVHGRDFVQAYRYLHEETPLKVPEMESKTKNQKASEETVEVAVERTDLVSLTPEGFEAYIADLWRAQGYSCKLTKGSGDGGIDIIAVQGDDHELIQAKRYADQNVGIETVQRTAGLLVDDEFNASEVTIVTTSGFTDDARQRGQRISNLTLIDGVSLVTLGNEVGVNVFNSDGDPAYPQEATTEQVLAAFSPGEPLTTAEVAERVNAPPRSVIGQLRSLLDEGEIQAKQVGNDGAVWYKNDL